MSLICAHCGKTIVMSDKPTHYGICAGCPINDVTQEEKNLISKGFKLDDMDVRDKMLRKQLSR